MIVAIWAEEKAWKSTMALTWPKPIKHYDLDVGGFARAIWRMDTTDIESKAYPTPVQMDKLMGIKKEGVTIHFPKKLAGIKETWQKIVVDFVSDCQDSRIATIVLDSATQLWTICHRGRLQELQEVQVFKKPTMDENDLREKLLPIEYGEPNDRMRSLIYTARSYGKNLILTHYPRPVYAEAMTPEGPKEYRTGEIEPDGFKETERLADIVIKNTVAKDNKVTATITRCGLPGLGSMVTGLPLPEPSYQGLQRLAESMGAKI
jgi:hypothetical protein